jgi:DNA repair exonuclease SbcCD ATPase subunit
MLSSIEDIWGCIFHLLSKASPTLTRRDLNSDLSLRERQTFLLGELFCFAVSDACLSRHDNAQIILRLSYDHRKCLLNIIKYGRHSISKECLQLLQMKGTPEIDVSDRLRRPVSDANNSPSGYTPVRKKRSPENLSVNRLFSPEPIHPSIERVIEDLKFNNESLKRDLERSTTREADLAIKLQELEMTVRRNMIKIESSSLRTIEEADAAHRKEIEELRYELHVLQDIQDREQMAQRQLTKLKDEIDLMQNAKEKLAETEEKYRKCRERLEKLADVKECLKREEEAHSASVSECLRLEAEIKSLAPLRRQLEEYKVRAVDAEVKLVECQEDLKRLKILSRNLNNTQEDLLGGTRVLQEEAEALRRKVTSDDKVASCPSIDEGISELNPVVMEELLRLRNENEQLREFAEKRSEDNVQRLEERLDDINRLSDRFRDQYLTTKQQLERTCVELEQTRESEEDLKEELAEWVSKFDEMSNQCDNLQREIETTKIELDSTCTLLKESRDIEENLREELTVLTKKYEKTAAESKERLHGWNLTKEELARTLQMLVQSQSREKDLHCELEEIEKSLQSEQQKCAGFENELDLTVDALESTKTELNSALDREKVLRETVSNLTEEKENIQLEHNREKQEREIEKVAAENLLRETHDKLEERARSALEELQENMNLLLHDERESFRTKIEKANADYDDLKKKTASEIDDLKFQMATSLEAKKLDYEARIAQLTYENTCEIEKIKTQAEKDRESLLTKGKSMMKETKNKAEEIIRELEDEVSDAKQLMSEVRKEKADFENKTRAKISSYKHKLQFSNARISEMSEEIEQLSGYIRGMEREKTQVIEENERFRRQLGGRYGVDGKNQNQMEMLQKEFNAILEENRMLKKKVASFGIAHSLPTITEEKDLEVDESKEKAYAGGRVSASTLLAFREEYEEIIQALNDEKRELMMKNSAAITDVQKAEQRSWELEKEIERLKEEITSVNLSLQRVELQMDDSKMEMSGMNENSFHTAKDNFYDGDADHSVSEQIDELGKENAGGFLELNSRDVTVLPTTPKSVLSPANHPNVLSNVKKTVSFWEERFKSPPETSKALNKPMGPTLMELTQKNGNAPEGQPECRQS